MVHRRQRALDLALLLAASLTGCGAPPASDPTGFTQATITATPKSDATKAAPAKETSEGGLNDDQKAQMEIALRRGSEKAANCAAVVPDAPRGDGEVKVTFDGVKGRVTDVAVGPPFAGTPVESCIKRSFVGEIVLPFDGELEVPYTVKLPPRPDDGKDAKGKAKDAKAKDEKPKDKK